MAHAATHRHWGHLAHAQAAEGDGSEASAGAQIWSRRRFLQAGGALVGAGTLSPLLGGAAMAAPIPGLPSPIPGFSPLLEDALGVEIPFFLPIEVDPFTGAFDPVSDPSTITDFNGFVGLVEADGVSDAEHNADEVARRWACDVRFMEGVFVDRGGRTRQGAFGFF